MPEEYKLDNGGVQTDFDERNASGQQISGFRKPGRRPPRCWITRPHGLGGGYPGHQRGGNHHPGQGKKSSASIKEILLFIMLEVKLKLI